MPSHPSMPPGEMLRHFTVAVFVVHSGKVLLHYHRKLGMWLPPGGHVEENELPDDAAIREVFEETGTRALLVGWVDHGVRGPKAEPEVGQPRLLVLPAGVQLENIYPGHQHIDLVYFAVPDPDNARSTEIDPLLAERDQVGWYSPSDIERLGANQEIQTWARRALDAISTRC